MRTDDLTSLLRAATAEQPFVPVPDRALVRVRQLRRRRRIALGGAAGALAVTGAAGVFAVGALGFPDTIDAPFAKEAASVAFEVERSTGPDVEDDECAIALVLRDASLPRILLPCEVPAYETKAGQVAPMVRQNKVETAGGTKYFTSGIAPAGTVGVTAVDKDGKQLIAELRSPEFTDVVVFVLVTDDDLVKDLAYTLADGKRSPSTTVFDDS
jgi:hypothetical protein